jgi:hypothetical protein
MKIEDEMHLIDLMVRVSSLEKLLIDNNFITKEQLVLQNNKIAEELTKMIIEKANVPQAKEILEKLIKTNTEN